MHPKVSIIIPVYNLETRIEKTLNSVLSQSFSDYEVIIIDDHSSDQSVRVIEDFFIKHPAVCCKLLKHSRNMGVSAARNSGITAASGDFIIFWDGDDLANKTFVSDLYMKANSGENIFDVVMSGHTERNENNGREKIFAIPIKLTKEKNPQQIACLRITGKIKSHMCSSIYRRSFLNDCSLRFYEGCTAGEDVEFAIKSLIRSHLTGFLEKNDYIYILHNKIGNKNNTDTPMIKRYEDNTMAHIRTTEYISSFAEYSDLKFINKYFLLPQTIQRKTHLLAAKNDHIAFCNKIQETKTRKILWNSIKSINIKAEIFIKSLLLLLIPQLYYIYITRKQNRTNKNISEKK